MSSRQEKADETYFELRGKGFEYPPRSGEPPEAEELARQLMMNAFGDAWSRAGLDTKTRQMITIAMIIAVGGAEGELRLHIAGALRLGIGKAEIVEIFIHSAAYLGALRTASAWSVARQIMAEHD